MKFTYNDVKKELEKKIQNTSIRDVIDNTLDIRLTTFIKPVVEGFINASFNNYHGIYKNIFHRFPVVTYHIRNLVRFNIAYFHVGKLVFIQKQKNKNYFVSVPVFKKREKYGTYEIEFIKTNENEKIYRFNKKKFMEIDIEKSMIGIIIGNYTTGYRGFPVSDSELLTPLIVVPIYKGDIFAIPYTQPVFNIENLLNIGEKCDIDENGRFTPSETGYWRLLYYTNNVIWLSYE